MVNDTTTKTTNKKKVSCKQCGKCFRYRYNLYKHEVVNKCDVNEKIEFRFRECNDTSLNNPEQFDLFINLMKKIFNNPTLSFKKAQFTLRRVLPWYTIKNKKN